jgi:hypothetical protein
MAREIKKPTKVNESQLKEYAGDVIIEIPAANTEVKIKDVPAKVADEAASIPVTTVNELKTLTFNAWFQKACAKNPRIKLSYREAIEAHCKAVGLLGPTSEEAYDAALQHFGL